VARGLTAKNRWLLQREILWDSFEMSSYVAWINTGHMKEAGLDPVANLPKTWKEFVDVCKKMTIRQNDVIVRNGFAINLKASFFHS
jgi:ABC-type glycerol-3-phosphate transport system substrate-binding protein